MRGTLASLVVLLAVLASAHAQPEPFDVVSPDQKFSAIYAPAADPPFKIVDKATHKLVSSMDDESVGSRGLTATWSPNSKTLVVLAEFRLGVSVEVFCFRDDQFDHVKGPDSPEDFLTFVRWTAPDKLQLKGENKSYTLILANGVARIESER